MTMGGGGAVCLLAAKNGGGGLCAYASRIALSSSKSASCSTSGAFSGSALLRMQHNAPKQQVLLSFSSRCLPIQTNTMSSLGGRHHLSQQWTAFSTTTSGNVGMMGGAYGSLLRSATTLPSTLSMSHTSKCLPFRPLRSSPSIRGTTQSLFLYQPTVLSTNIGSISHLSNIPPNRGSPPPRNRLTAGLASLGGAGLLLMGKGKYLLGALKLTKFASLGSMLVTVGTYSIFYGWPFAVGMVGLILVHESGHALVMHKLGIPFKPMVFVPFLGAAVAMKERPRDAYEEALVAFGGPVLGSLGAAGVGAAGIAMDSNLLIALSDFGFMINLFNLLPIGMMDGGRICGAVSPYAGVVGLGIGGAMIYNGMISNPIFYLVMLAGGWETFQKFYSPQTHVPPNYYAISGRQRAAITGGYFSLVAALMAAMSVSTALKKSPEQLRRERQLGVYHLPDEY